MIFFFIFFWNRTINWLDWQFSATFISDKKFILQKHCFSISVGGKNHRIKKKSSDRFCHFDFVAWFVGNRMVFQLLWVYIVLVVFSHWLPSGFSSNYCQLWFVPFRIVIAENHINRFLLDFMLHMIWYNCVCVCVCIYEPLMHLGFMELLQELKRSNVNVGR